MKLFSTDKIRGYGLGLGLLLSCSAFGQVPFMMPFVQPQMLMQQQMAVAPNPLSMLNLSAEQQQQISEIGNQARARSVEIMNQIGNIYSTLRDKFAAAQPDVAAISEAYGTIFELQRQSIELALETYNQQLQILSEQQQAMWNNMRQAMLNQFMPAQPVPAQPAQPPAAPSQ